MGAAGRLGAQLHDVVVDRLPGLAMPRSLARQPARDQGREHVLITQVAQHLPCPPQAATQLPDLGRARRRIQEVQQGLQAAAGDPQIVHRVRRFVAQHFGFEGHQAMELPQGKLSHPEPYLGILQGADRGLVLPVPLSLGVLVGLAGPGGGCRPATGKVRLRLTPVSCRLADVGSRARLGRSLPTHG